ncbi:MAG: bifunctional (p)ppGpp synthetase/guanosine-3',5'-bis(diphosphate) 3'-pyrophosphohydrolase [Proteobacteria bacterium]|jgi:GTP pyrophosphokinase|nr:bifunctional (p)ppGpp synthetase/guanosine-3',5'-bis(diphosphate) 3'-pyrophosphohydrolase [Pseudomonadota bacterium]
MIRINDILDKHHALHPNVESTVIQKAYIYASRKHEGQARKSGEPYLVHPLEVAYRVAEMGLDEASICAALLHDTIEDTDTTREELSELFGEDVAELVDGLTKLSKVEFTQREERQAESFRKMLVATARDIRVLLIKLADRLHNMSTLEHLAPEAQERIAQETRDIYAPLANRLGIGWLKAELDDLAFRYLEPEAFADLSQKVEGTRKSRAAYIDRTLRELEQFIAEAGYEVTVSGRLKNLYSIHQKMKAKGLDYEKVYDTIAFRVVCKAIPDCYAIFGLIHSRWTPVPSRIKDYIAIPKPNRYRSLHTTVVGTGGERMEIQLRTEEMHQVNEFGVAAHWAYKEGSGKASVDAFRWVREMLENQDGLSDSREFLDSVKVDLFLDEVFVFTPRGDVISLRKGSTPLDFAFAIHTEVGNHCTGARVNGVQVPFTTELRNGDWIEIMTSKNQRPSTDWLDIAVSSKARNKIRSFLRAEERTQSIQAGRDLLERGLRRFGCSFNRIMKSGELDDLAREFKLSNADDVLAAVGHGRVDKDEVIDRLLPEDKKAAPPSEVRETPFEKVIRKVIHGQDAGIVLDGVDNLLIRFARCCNPLPGEEVVGYVSRGRGIVVHRRNCSKAAVLDPQRQTKVQWAATAVSQRPVCLQVLTANRPGILAELSSVFVTKGINLDSANCQASHSDRGVNTFTFSVKDLEQLNGVVRTLKQIKGVYEILRTHAD